MSHSILFRGWVPTGEGAPPSRETEIGIKPPQASTVSCDLSFLDCLSFIYLLSAVLFTFREASRFKHKVIIQVSLHLSACFLLSFGTCLPLLKFWVLLSASLCELLFFLCNNIFNINLIYLLSSSLCKTSEWQHIWYILCDTNCECKALEQKICSISKTNS